MGLGRYRKVYVRVWNDEGFRGLTPIPPCGQGLWLFLLTTRLGSAIPGLIAHGEAAIAGELRWSLKAFREAFREAFAKGMAKVDWDAPLVWLPHAPAYNSPESPNVLRAWGKSFDEVPDCELKWLALQELKAFTEGLGEGFRKAFGETFPKPSVIPSLISSSSSSSEQETTSMSSRNGSGPTVRALFAFWQWWTEKHQAQLTPERERLLKLRLANYAPLLIVRGILGCCTDPFNRGENDRHREYVDLTLICRTGAKLEGYADRFKEADVEAEIQRFIRDGHESAANQLRAEPAPRVQHSQGTA